jgi:hypothetical protein
MCKIFAPSLCKQAAWYCTQNYVALRRSEHPAEFPHVLPAPTSLFMFDIDYADFPFLRLS